MSLPRDRFSTTKIIIFIIHTYEFIYLSRREEKDQPIIMEYMFVILKMYYPYLPDII